MVPEDRWYDQSWGATIDRAINRSIVRPIFDQSLPQTNWNRRLEVLNMTIDLVTPNFAVAITHDLCDQSTFFLRLAHGSNIFRLQAGRNLVARCGWRFKPQSYQAYDQVTTYLRPKNGPIVEITYDWSQRSYDWSRGRG